MSDRTLSSLHWEALWNPFSCRGPQAQLFAVSHLPQYQLSIVSASGHSQEFFSHILVVAAAAITVDAGGAGSSRVLSAPCATSPACFFCDKDHKQAKIPLRRSLC